MKVRIYTENKTKKDYDFLLELIRNDLDNKIAVFIGSEKQVKEFKQIFGEQHDNK
jgi:fructose-1,6-bisphosphatase